MTEIHVSIRWKSTASEPDAQTETMIEKQKEMTSSSMFHKALRTVEDSSYPERGLWPPAPHMHTLPLSASFKTHTSSKDMSL